MKTVRSYMADEEETATERRAAENTLRTRKWKTGYELRDWVRPRLTEIGGGNYAEVYSLGSRNVVKLAYGDDCWGDYAEFAKKRKNNKYLPNVEFHREYQGPAETPRGYPAKFFSVTIMEKLKAVSWEDGDRLARSLSEEEKFGLLASGLDDYQIVGSLPQSLIRLDAGSGPGKRLADAARKHMKKHRHPFYKTILAIEDLGRKSSVPCTLDLHFENFMLRGSSQIVLTDPLYYFR